MLNQAIADMSKRKPPALCLLCDHSFRKKQAPAAFVLLLAAVEDPHASITSPLRHTCAAPHLWHTLTERAAQKYKERMIPDLRVLPTPSAPGRA